MCKLGGARDSCQGAAGVLVLVDGTPLSTNNKDRYFTAQQPPTCVPDRSTQLLALRNLHACCSNMSAWTRVHPCMQWSRSHPPQLAKHAMHSKARVFHRNRMQAQQLSLHVEPECLICACRRPEPEAEPHIPAPDAFAAADTHPEAEGDRQTAGGWHTGWGVTFEAKARLVTGHSYPIWYYGSEAAGQSAIVCLVWPSDKGPYWVFTYIPAYILRSSPPNTLRLS